MSTRLVAGFTLLVLAAAPAEAQRRILSRPWPAPPPAQTSDAVAETAPVLPAPSEQAPAEPAAAPMPEAPRGGALQVFGRTDLRVSLPAGWPEGVADEGRLPAYARYTFEAPPGPLAGTTLRVERVAGLNPAEEQQWRGGRTPYGYHGARPIAVLPAADGALTFETAGSGTHGATTFLQRGRAFWAVSVVAPQAAWQAHRDDVLALVQAVTIPAGEPVPGVVAAPRRGR